MKKHSVILILVVIVIALSSCSQEKLGNFMGWMGNNVYGIKPDLRKSNAAISIVDKISGTDSLDLSVSGELIESVSKFKSSQSSVDAFKDSMSKRVDTSRAAFTVVKNDMDDKVRAIKDDPSMDENAQNIMIVLEEVVNSMTDLVFDNPTRRDVVTVAMVNELVNDVYNSAMAGPINLEAISNKAAGVLDVLKLSADFSSLNIIGDIDMSGLIDSLIGKKSIDRADSKVAVHIIGRTVGKVTDLITASGSYDKTRYDRFMMEARSVMVAYEMTFAPFVFVDDQLEMLSMLFGSAPDFGMEVDDFTTFLSTGLVSLIKKMENLPNGMWEEFLGNFLQGDNVVALSDLKNNGSLLKNPKESIPANSFYAYVADRFGIEDVDISEAGDGSEIWHKEDIVEDAIDNLHLNITQAGGFSLVTLMQFIAPLLNDVEQEDVATDESAMQELINLLVEELSEAIAESKQSASGEHVKVDMFVATMTGILVDTRLFGLLFGI